MEITRDQLGHEIVEVTMGFDDIRFRSYGVYYWVVDVKVLDVNNGNGVLLSIHARPTTSKSTSKNYEEGDEYLDLEDFYKALKYRGVRA